MQYHDAQIIEACKVSHSIREVMLRLGARRPYGSAHTNISRRIHKLGIDISHFKHLGNNGNGFTKKSATDILVVYDTIYKCPGTFQLRRAMIELGIQYRCECGQLPEWNGRPLILQVDHKDGNRANCEIGNLRFLCPNCHSQTETFGVMKSSKVKRYRSGLRFIARMNGTLRRETPKSNNQPTVIRWPSVEELKQLVWKMPMTHLAKQLGVSDKAIKRRCNKFDIQTPDAYFWSNHAAILQR